MLKIGTNSLVGPGGRIRHKLLEHLALDVKAAMADGWFVAIVTSGAVACGKKEVFLQALVEEEQEAINQVYSMIGQPVLMKIWAKAFAKVGLKVGQGLLTNRMLESLPERKRIIFQGLMNCFKAGVVPILNENDAAVLDELKEMRHEGDNDHFATLVGSLLNATVLVFLTTIEGLKDPATKELIPLVDAKDKELVARIEAWPDQSNGGMASKVAWGQQFVINTGGKAIIKKYDEEFPLSRALRGIRSGTKIELM
jgi:glutamate 5-kinase